ncbi:MAG: hypothetical protein R2697_18350 [Ilumatobacteraceae bacterium]
MAADTSNAKPGMLVTGNNYRNPELLADMARTLDHVSGGRMYLRCRCRLVRARLHRVRLRVRNRPGPAASPRRRPAPHEGPPRKLNPAPVGDLPILIGGSNEKVTLRLVAQYAGVEHVRSAGALRRQVEGARRVVRSTTVTRRRSSAPSR